MHHIEMSSPFNFGLRFVSHLLVLLSVVQVCLLSCVKPDQFQHEFSTIPFMKTLIFPSQIEAVINEEIYVKITEPVAHQTHCYYRLNNGKDIDVKRPHKQSFQAMDGEPCGLVIKNVNREEHGFIRLTSTNDNNDVARGIVFINVTSEAPPIKKDIESFNDNISPERTSYCYVTRPDGSKTNFPLHEHCAFPESSRHLEGNGVWQIVSGIKGKTNEVSFEVNVQPIVEELQTFVEHDRKASTLKMKCKLVNSRKKITFCRWLRLIDEMGFNLEDGRGDDRYSYFGNGFKSLECGISVANADQSDKSPWKCIVGVEDDGELDTYGAIVDGTDPQEPTQGDIETNDVFGLEKTNVNILCKRYIPTDYCWWTDPTGQKISISDKKTENEPNWLNKMETNTKYMYYGTGIKLGECGLTIIDATHSHSGTWSCHMGATSVSSTDTVKEISVRIKESPLVATNLFHDAQQGHTLLLECRSIPEHLPLDYCRFVLPDGTGFSINEKTTSDNPHMNIHFNQNRHMKSGYCSIIVKKVDRSHHQGQWMCAARITGTAHECSDEFRVTVFESNLSTASITGMVFSIIFLIGGIAFITYKRYRQTFPLRRTTELTQRTVVSYIANTDNVSISSYPSNFSQSGDSEVHVSNSQSGQRNV